VSLKFENGTTHNFIYLLKRQTPFERLGTLSYSPSIATMAVPLAISETFSVKEWPDLEIWLRGHSVIEIGAIQKLGCGFLFAFYSNYGAILYRLRDIATYWSKIESRNFYTAPVFSARHGLTPSEFGEDV